MVYRVRMSLKQDGRIGTSPLVDLLHFYPFEGISGLPTLSYLVAFLDQTIDTLSRTRDLAMRVSLS